MWFVVFLLAFCQSREEKYLQEVEKIMQGARQKLNDLLKKARTAKSKEEVIEILRQYGESVKKTAQEYRELANRYPELTENKKKIEEKFHQTYQALRQGLGELQERIKKWQKEFQRERDFQNALEEAIRASREAEESTRPEI